MKNTLTYLSSDAFPYMLSELVPDLQGMFSLNDSFRPTVMDFTGTQFPRNDTRLRALCFLDYLHERGNIQKSGFLKALLDMWKDLDSRVLRYKVLPPLCAELRNVVIQPMFLPMVLTIAKSQDKNDFEQSTLPALVPVLSTTSGDTMLLLLKHAELIKITQEHLISHVLPLLRACKTAIITTRNQRQGEHKNLNEKKEEIHLNAVWTKDTESRAGERAPEFETTKEEHPEVRIPHYLSNPVNLVVTGEFLS
ncbi:hypothetical protein KIW84_062824 [Lathyrus oleraceus]|uniref:Uncharacterized protein n=1 Tax=Pisum sativum TaxID=3888 RepID=A0A9D4W870_PEA|nr:hypothetical protein KIW84_062824 [Pisum sativum]